MRTFPSLPFLSPPYPPSHTFPTPLSFCSFHFPFPSFSSSPAAKRSPNPAKVSGKSCKFSQRDPRYFCDILSQETWQPLQTKPCRQERHSLREDEAGAITHSDLGPLVVSAVDIRCAEMSDVACPLAAPLMDLVAEFGGTWSAPGQGVSPEAKGPFALSQPEE